MGTITFLYCIQFMAIATSLASIRLWPWLARSILATALVAAIASGLSWARMDDGRRTKGPVGVVRIILLVFLLAALSVYLILWAAAYIAPDLSVDGNSYHIPTISLWDSVGHIHWIRTSYLEPLLNGYPKGMETVTYVVVKGLNSQFANAANLIFLPMGILGIALITTMLGASPGIALCAGAAFLLIPVNIHQSQTAYVDTAYASSAIGFLAILLWARRNSTQSWRADLPLGGALALTLSAKGSGVALGGIGMLAYFAMWLVDEMEEREYEVIRLFRRLSASLGAMAPRLLLLGLLSLTGGFWYIRNFLMTGSPLYPVGIELFGQTVLPGKTISAAIHESSMIPPQMQPLSPILRVLYSWGQGLAEWPGSLRMGGGHDTPLAGLGYLWLIGCVPAIVAALILSRRQPPHQRNTLIALLAVISLAFLSTPLNWWARFVVWIYALGLPCFGLIISRIVLRHEPRSRIWRAMVGMWLAASSGVLAFEAAYSLYNVVARASPGSLSASPAAFFAPRNWTWPVTYLFPDMAGTILEEILSNPGNIAIGPRGNMELWRYYGLVGQLSQPIGERDLVFIAEAEGAADQAQDLQANFVIWDPTLAVPPELAAMAARADRAAGYLVFTMPPAC